VEASDPNPHLYRLQHLCVRPRESSSRRPDQNIVVHLHHIPGIGVEEQIPVEVRFRDR
jgi:hypothetical protein